MKTVFVLVCRVLCTNSLYDYVCAHHQQWRDMSVLLYKPHVYVYNLFSVIRKTFIFLEARALFPEKPPLSIPQR